METRWYKQALLGGMTVDAFRLGTVLSLGWFWMRRNGCCLLYRRKDAEIIDVSRLLSVANNNTEQIEAPTYLSNKAGSLYFYVVNRANGCGYVERSFSGAVKVCFNQEGHLAVPIPNNVVNLKAGVLAGPKVRLGWYYCPLEEGAKPILFRVYWDGGNGQIDYQNPLAAINYEGQGFYHFHSQTLVAGAYHFAVMAVDSNGIEGNSQTVLRIKVADSGPDIVRVANMEVL